MACDLIFASTGARFGQSETTPPPDKQSAQTNGQESPPKVVTIPNGLTVSQDGTGQFKTITEALAKIEPRQTILVLDDAVYREEMKIDDPERHQGITFQAQKEPRLSGVRILPRP